MAFESDEGSTKPYGYGFNGNAEALAILTKLAETNLDIINCTKIFKDKGDNADVAPFERRGIPIMNN